jgi:hypothetical protein
LDELRSDVPAVQRVLVDALIMEVRRLAAALVDALYAPVEQRTRENRVARHTTRCRPGANVLVESVRSTPSNPFG